MRRLVDSTNIVALKCLGFVSCLINNQTVLSIAKSAQRVRGTKTGPIECLS